MAVGYFMLLSGPPEFIQSYKSFKDYLDGKIRGKPGWVDVWKAPPGMQARCEFKTKDDAEEAFACCRERAKTHIFEDDSESMFFKFLECNCPSNGICNEGFDKQTLIPKKHFLSKPQWFPPQQATGYQPPPETMTPRENYQTTTAHDAAGLPVNIGVEGATKMEYCSVFIGNIPYGITVQELRDWILEKAGIEAVSCEIKKGKGKKPKVHALVRYASSRDAGIVIGIIDKKTIKISGRDLNERVLNARVAKEGADVGKLSPPNAYGSG
ncbi:hypothetical protein CC80DRAFT_501738 [Byssothecium circinans]|uniref:RRM domain-containing protein n=1 Tax=Byssothecium circinans TaxID=147558 RepID=A0A6A5U6C6_9PLEO|nr:hypothetical protein CC80DRAFT_501738 [Byssothecium circinans]